MVFQTPSFALVIKRQRGNLCIGKGNKSTNTQAMHVNRPDQTSPMTLMEKINPDAAITKPQRRKKRRKAISS